MPLRFSIVMTCFGTWHFLPRAIACVLRQEHEDWELLLVSDGPPPAGRLHPRTMLRRLRQPAGHRRMELVELPASPGCFGNVGRNAALARATGDYVCWVNHDNLIAPRYLPAHAANIAKRPGCVSVVDIDYWRDERYIGRLPRRFARSHIDLLNFAVPLEAARAVNAFGGAMCRVYAADWLVFDACRRCCPVEHNRTIVGTHF